MPWNTGNSNSYTAPRVGDQVWVANFSDNPMQLYWVRKDDRVLNKALESQSNVEVVCNRETGLGNAAIYYTDEQGWMIQNGDTFITLPPNGGVEINGEQIILNTERINIGNTEDATHPAVLGDELQKVLIAIQAALATVQQSASCNAYTVAIANALGSQPMRIKNMIDNITSSSLTIHE